MSLQQGHDATSVADWLGRGAEVEEYEEVYMSENWHEERDRLVKLIEAIKSGQVTHVDQADMRELQTTNLINVAALEARLKQLNVRLGNEA
jgi:hypothetical protein